jgi:hypothetical protein
MTALVWDQAGERRYETGVDRGVLYPPNGVAVPWNGLISVNETVSREVKPYYIDGIKFLDHHVPGSYSAKLSAFTYPDEMDELIGTQEFVPGVFVHDQRSPKLFNLSYRTLVANDLEGLDHAYKIHILYNLMAVPGDATYSTNGESVEPMAFEWSIYGTPSQMFGIRPTSHISLDSRRIDPAMLETLEELLYGSEDSDPTLPNLVDLLLSIESP